MWWHYLLSSTKAFGLTIKEGAEAVIPTETSLPTTSQSSATDMGVILLQIAVSVLPIILAAIFSAVIKDRIRQRENFNGISWGFANSFGAGFIGLLCVVIAHNSINKELSRVKDKQYVTYAKNELKRFIKSYAICYVVMIVIAALLLSNQINQG